MIEPTVGRIVWYFCEGAKEPLAAIVTQVHSPRVINICVFSKAGIPKGETSILLFQDGEKPEGPAWCEWMPYQKGQAAKHEALEKMNQKVSA